MTRVCEESYERCRDSCRQIYEEFKGMIPFADDFYLACLMYCLRRRQACKESPTPVFIP